MEVDKNNRILYMFQELINGKGVSKIELVNRFKVNERTIQRDLEDLREYFEEQIPRGDIIYDRQKREYYLFKQESVYLTISETFAVCKILLESRYLREDEMMPILDRLVACCVPENNRKSLEKLLANEKYHYIEPQHKQHILDKMWDIGQAIQKCQYIEMEYERIKEPKIVKRKVQPVGIMFSEYYFYLTAFLDDKSGFENPDDLFPTIYRIDRIKSYQVLDEHFKLPYKNRFQEGEFRKRVQFMYGGKLERIKFKYVGESVEAILDRLPTAKIVEHDKEGWVISAEVFGKGIDMWLKSQGDRIRMIS